MCRAPHAVPRAESNVPRRAYARGRGRGRAPRAACSRSIMEPISLVCQRLHLRVQEDESALLIPAPSLLLPLGMRPLLLLRLRWCFGLLRPVGCIVGLTFITQVGVKWLGCQTDADLLCGRRRCANKHSVQREAPSLCCAFGTDCWNVINVRKRMPRSSGAARCR